MLRGHKGHRDHEAPRSQGSDLLVLNLKANKVQRSVSSKVTGVREVSSHEAPRSQSSEHDKFLKANKVLRS